VGRDRRGARGAAQAALAGPDVARDDEDLYSDQHALIVGVNGCGKSTLASFLGARSSRVLVLDSKGIDPVAVIPNAQVATGFKAAAAALRGGAARLVYRPTREEMAYGRDGHRLVAWHFDQLLAILWEQGGAFRVVVHEIADIADQDWTGPVLDETIRKGRFVHLCLIVCSQWPNRIPMELRSECKHVFVYTLIDEGHRKVVSQYAGPAARELVPMDRSFLHRGPSLIAHHHPPLAR